VKTGAFCFVGWLSGVGCEATAVASPACRRALLFLL
jgi:hypothetical protein